MKHFATLCGDAYALHKSTLKISYEYFHYYGRYGPKIEFFALITQKKICATIYATSRWRRMMKFGIDMRMLF